METYICWSAGSGDCALPEADTQAPRPQRPPPPHAATCAIGRLPDSVRCRGRCWKATLRRRHGSSKVRTARPGDATLQASFDSKLASLVVTSPRPHLLASGRGAQGLEAPPARTPSNSMKSAVDIGRGHGLHDRGVAALGHPRTLEVAAAGVGGRMHRVVRLPVGAALMVSAWFAAAPLHGSSPLAGRFASVFGPRVGGGDCRPAPG